MRNKLLPWRWFRKQNKRRNARIPYLFEAMVAFNGPVKYPRLSNVERK
tara:strand:+ start:468 stop:611 length:144 start_codon:yes stop_codon:yes gene_type:complete